MNVEEPKTARGRHSEYRAPLPHRDWNPIVRFTSRSYVGPIFHVQCEDAKNVEAESMCHEYSDKDVILRFNAGSSVTRAEDALEMTE